jgi:hypothetical protein
MMERNSRKPQGDEDYELTENKKQQMYQLGHIIKTLDDYKQIKKQVDFHEKLLKDVDQWRHQQSQQLSKDLVQKAELSLLIEMLKSDIQTSMRSHFEIFKNETEGGITRKVEQKDLQEALSKKISSLEFWREIDYVKSMIHTVSRDLALAGLAGQSSGGGGNKSSSNSAIKTLIR